jgi:hypothetical protein
MRLSIYSHIILLLTFSLSLNVIVFPQTISQQDIEVKNINNSLKGLQSTPHFVEFLLIKRTYLDKSTIIEKKSASTATVQLVYRSVKVPDPSTGERKQLKKIVDLPIELDTGLPYYEQLYKGQIINNGNTWDFYLNFLNFFEGGQRSAKYTFDGTGVTGYLPTESRDFAIKQDAGKSSSMSHFMPYYAINVVTFLSPEEYSKEITKVGEKNMIKYSKSFQTQDVAKYFWDPELNLYTEFQHWDGKGLYSSIQYRDHTNINGFLLPSEIEFAEFRSPVFEGSLKTTSLFKNIKWSFN